MQLNLDRLIVEAGTSMYSVVIESWRPLGFDSLNRRSKRPAYRISVAAAAVASAIFAQRTSGVTLNQYYFDVSVYSDPGLTNLVSSVVINQAAPVVSVPVGDYLSFGISDVLTNNSNPAAGDTSGRPGHNPAQPAYLGISDLEYIVASSDTSASYLAPNLTAGIRGTLLSGQVDYYSTAKVQVSSVMPNDDPGDIVPASTAAGNIGLNFQIFAGANPQVNAGSSTGIATLTAFTPTTGSTASFANSTPLFDYLSYQGTSDGTVTLTPATYFDYWVNTSIGSGTTVSTYAAEGFGSQAGDTIVPLPALTVNVFDAPPPTHAIIALTANAPGSFGYGPLDVGDVSQEIPLQGAHPNDATDFISITNLTLTPQTQEVIALALNVTGNELNTLVADINSTDVYGYGAAIASTTMAADPFPSDYNLFLTFSDGQMPPITNGTDYLSFDFAQDPNVDGVVVDAVGATVVPEPMSLGGVVLGSVCLFSLRRRRRERRGKQLKAAAG